MITRWHYESSGLLLVNDVTFVSDVRACHDSGTWLNSVCFNAAVFEI
jgi:hypothetical protein